MHKKSAPREKWKQSVFNIPYFLFSALLPHFTFCHSAPLPMYAETEQHCFYILLAWEFPWPSHPSVSPYFTFLPVMTSRSRCCYLPGFQQPVTSTSCSLLQKLSPTTFLDALPAVPDTCWEVQPVMSNLEDCGKKEEPIQGSGWWKEVEGIWVKDWGVPLQQRYFFLLLFPKLTL